MRRLILTLLVLSHFAIVGFAAENDTLVCNGIRYQVTKEDPAAQAFEVSAVYFDSAYIILPDSVANNEYAYAVTNTIQWYHPQNCALRHYSKIDMSQAKHITALTNQISALIAVDTLILPPNLQRFPMYFYTSDTINYRNRLMDYENLLPGIHRIQSTGTQADEYVVLNKCTSLLEADLSTYTTTNRSASGHADQFSQNPFLERLVIPNTIEVLYTQAFDYDLRLSDVNIPDSLEQIDPHLTTSDLPMDTLQLGKKVSEIAYVFAEAWYSLKHIEVDSANPYFMSDSGVLYTKNQSVLFHYPCSRAGSEFHIPSCTDTIGFAAFANASYYFGKDVVVRNHQQMADSAPLKKVVCHPKLKYIAGEGTFSGSSIRELVGFAETYITEIPIHCFSYAAIDSITMPWRMTDIGFQAFSFAYNLRSITNLNQLSNLRHIGEGAFRDAWKLEKMDLLPCDKLLSIPKTMCYNDSALEFVSLPRYVQTIGDGAFQNCVSLQQFVCPATDPIEIDESVFEGVDKQTCVLKVPTRSLALYKSAPVWQEFFHIDTTGFYYIEAVSSDTLAGTVTGSGAYLTGESAILEAKANGGYRFAAWSDGYPYNPRAVKVTKDGSYTAIFEEIPLYTLTVLSNDSSMETVTGSGIYEEGMQITITATPYEGYDLQSWDFTDEVSTDIIFTMPSSDTTLTAYFAPKDESVETIENAAMPHKVLKEGTFYILRNNKTYSLQGQEVK